ncbi:hypothetical protein BpHYR1_053442 [Brachionus plicatilis]|uniref:Uncharacterized protein n=1 Tax=Brachionus plicatilis TaxID=10195 RepID=A0A3M7QHV2_BRAPC|nr:hypothetical protein BpHYR1_053442 [Brachionus plicatilis]
MGEMVFIACVKVVFRVLKLQYRTREYGNNNRKLLCISVPETIWNVGYTLGFLINLVFNYFTLNQQTYYHYHHLSLNKHLNQPNIQRRINSTFQPHIINLITKMSRFLSPGFKILNTEEEIYAKIARKF